MAEIQANAGATADAPKQDTTKKVNRRGIGSARGSTRLKFDNRDAQSNGLFITHIASVEVREITIGEETTGLPSFNGMTIPRVVITFSSNHADVTKRKFVDLDFTAVESNVETIPGGKGEWKVNQIFDYMKHILNVFVLKGRDFTPEEEAALSLSFEDFDDEGLYVPVSSEDVIAGWKSLFENFATIMNTGREGSPVYQSKDGKPISIWTKLLRFTKRNKGGWAPVRNGDLAFNAFVGEGAIEIYKQNQDASLNINMVRETINVMEIEKPKAPNMPTPPMPGGAMVQGGVPMAGGNVGMAPDFLGGQPDDTPF